jgi:glucosamine kinase
VSSPCKIGVDGGGTKTECILIDARGDILARHLAPGCNPNVVGCDQARRVVTDSLRRLVQAACRGETRRIAATHIYAAGNRGFWRDLAAALDDFGPVFTADDSHPVLELATGGRPGLVLHSGTGSFVAARAPDGSMHYAGGLGWRFGDPGSGYDVGRRAVSRALLELQGWAPPSRLGPTVRAHTGLGAAADAAAVTRFFYHQPEPNQHIAGLAPTILRLASEGDPSARQLLVESVAELVTLGTGVAAKLFPETPLDTVPAGLSGPLLMHPVVLEACALRSPLPFKPVEGAPIEGVRRLLLRAG